MQYSQILSANDCRETLLNLHESVESSDKKRRIRDEREELRRLRRENKQLRIEREILSKAAA